MDFQLPKIIAHRGAPKLAPENTLASLKAAKEAGAAYVEFDVMLTKDGVPVIFHDKTLNRTTNGVGNLIDKTYDQLAKLDAGSWFDPKFCNEKIPTLEQYLQTAAALKLGVNIELKAAAKQEQRLAEVTLDALEKNWAKDLPTPLLSSFSVNNLKAIHAKGGTYPLALNVEIWKTSALKAAKALNCYSIHINHTQAQPSVIKINRAHGFKTLAYTVNGKTHAMELFKLGVDAVFSDIPNLCD